MLRFLCVCSLMALTLVVPSYKTSAWFARIASHLISWVIVKSFLVNTFSVFWEINPTKNFDELIVLVSFHVQVLAPESEKWKKTLDGPHRTPIRWTLPTISDNNIGQWFPFPPCPLPNVVLQVQKHIERKVDIIVATLKEGKWGRAFVWGWPEIFGWDCIPYIC